MHTSLLGAPLTGAAGLGEFRIRDLNDEVNKLSGARYHWERRIMELGAAVQAWVALTAAGGPNYTRAGSAKLLNDSGKEIPGQRGYRCRAVHSQPPLMDPATTARRATSRACASCLQPPRVCGACGVAAAEARQIPSRRSARPRAT